MESFNDIINGEYLLRCHDRFDPKAIRRTHTQRPADADTGKGRSRFDRSDRATASVKEDQTRRHSLKVIFKPSALFIINT